MANNSVPKASFRLPQSLLEQVRAEAQAGLGSAAAVITAALDAYLEHPAPPARDPARPFTVNLDPQRQQALEALAAAYGVSVSELVREALGRWLADEDEEGERMDTMLVGAAPA